MTKRYPIIKDSEVTVIKYKEEFLCFACCDCGMVHHWNFDVKDEELHIMLESQPRKTGQLRRHKFGNLHNVVSDWWLGKIGDANANKAST